MLHFKGIVHLRMGLYFILEGSVYFQGGCGGKSRWKIGRSQWSRSREPRQGEEAERENPAFGSSETILHGAKSSIDGISSYRW
jgi:hypothetical protein